MARQPRIYKRGIDNKKKRLKARVPYTIPIEKLTREAKTIYWRQKVIEARPQQLIQKLASNLQRK